jgi:hypothetical protein
VEHALVHAREHQDGAAHRFLEPVQELHPGEGACLHPAISARNELAGFRRDATVAPKPGLVSSGALGSPGRERSPANPPKAFVHASESA